MKPNKECVEAIFNFIVANTYFNEGNIEDSATSDSNVDIFSPKSDVTLADIAKECSEFSTDEIKTALWLLQINDLIAMTLNKFSKPKGVFLTPRAYSKIFADLINPSRN